MGFSDIFKKSFIEGFSRYDMSTVSLVATFCITLLFALYVIFVYRLLTRKSFYSKSFNISLAAVTLITSAIIMTIQSSVVISLGMVGALSIVRFRTAIKEPMDLAFLFWAISNGIICGAGLAEVAVPLAIVLTLLVVFLDKIPVAKAPRILMVSYEGYDEEEKVLALARQYAKAVTVKSRSLSAGRTDLVIELRIPSEQEGKLVRELGGMEKITSASLLAHDGEVTV